MSDGQVLWQKSVRAVLPEDPYQGMLTEHGYASSTPAADGERVYVFFGKSGVLAFDFDGNPLWQASVGTGSAIMGWGSAASLTLHKNLVIVNANAESEALVALDKATGRVVWKSETKGYAGSWSTPILVDVEGRQELVVFMPGEIWALHPDDGTLAWFCSGLRGSATSSLVSRDGIVFAASGGPGGSGAVAVRAGGNDEVNSSRVLWRASVGSYVPSPALVGKHLFWVDDRGVATCLAAESGEQVYRERLPGAGGHYASVVAADGKLFAVSRRNGTFVLEAKPEFKVLAHNRIQSDSSDFNASPAISNDALLLRSNRSLYRLGASGATR
jgi:outer membrane protein assembly factor BamB